jgi:serine phosphatase RsbU (regulator of sigma subunit)
MVKIINSELIKYRILLFVLFSANFLYPQPTIFLDQLKSLPQPIRSEFLTDGFKDFYKKDSVKALKELEMSFSSFSNDKKYKAAYYTSKAYVYSRVLNWNEAIRNEYKSMHIYDSLLDYENSINALMRINKYCNVFNRKDTLLNIFFGRLKAVEGNSLLEMMVLERIGIHFKENFNEAKGLEYLEKAYEISRSIEINSRTTARIFIGIYKNLGVLYRNKSEFEKAEFLFNKGIAIAEEYEETEYQGVLLNSLGVLYRERGDYLRAIEMLEKSVKLKMVKENKLPVATTLANLGNLYLKTGDLKKAESNLKQAETIILESKDLKRKILVSEGFYKLYQKRNDQNNAYKYAQLLIVLKDSLNKQNLAEENAKLEAIYGAEKKQKEIEFTQLKNKQLESNIQAKTRENKFILSGTLLLLLLLTWSVFSYYGKRKANKELEQKNKLIVTQKIKVEEQHKEIIDSITYAKRLQEGILPSEDLFSSAFKDFFILYKPKDIVAGDFYWLEIKSDFVFVAVADCTGHGVPGALVSMVCSNALNRCVHEFAIVDPGKILDKTRELVLQSFEKGGMDVKDGMDISLLVINTKEKRIRWAGANNPLWYIDSGGFKQIIADKQPIGKSFHYEPFKTHDVAYSSGLKLYLFSDGYADQFGGPRGKKMMQNRFSEHVKEVSSQTMLKQKQALESFFDNWKGDIDQLDDVCVIGLELT